MSEGSAISAFFLQQLDRFRHQDELPGPGLPEQLSAENSRIFIKQQWMRMVASGRMPVHRLIEIARDTRPKQRGGAHLADETLRHLAMETPAHHLPQALVFYLAETRPHPHRAGQAAVDDWVRNTVIGLCVALTVEQFAGTLPIRLPDGNSTGGKSSICLQISEALRARRIVLGERRVWDLYTTTRRHMSTHETRLATRQRAGPRAQLGPVP